MVEVMVVWITSRVILPRDLEETTFQVYAGKADYKGSLFIRFFGCRAELSSKVVRVTC